MGPGGRGLVWLNTLIEKSWQLVFRFNMTWLKVSFHCGQKLRSCSAVDYSTFNTLACVVVTLNSSFWQNWNLEPCWSKFQHIPKLYRVVCLWLLWSCMSCFVSILETSDLRCWNNNPDGSLCMSVKNSDMRKKVELFFFLSKRSETHLFDSTSWLKPRPSPVCSRLAENVRVDGGHISLIHSVSSCSDTDRSHL